MLESIIDPRNPGPGLAIVIDGNNTSYFEIRSIELIREAILHPDIYQDNLTKAITLLALAKCIKNEPI